MTLRLLIPAVFAAFGAVACNPSGTCVSEREVGDLGAQCTINTNKKACESQDGAPKFYAEEGAAGVLRCKSAGYTDPPGAAKASDPKALHVYFKKSKK